jgi:histidinol dehydrogenase
MSEIAIARLDVGSLHFETQLDLLRHRLSPSGNVVSQRGRELTLKVFGEALSPEQVVVRICEDVKRKGTEALLHYCEQLDGSKCTADQLKVPPAVIAKAHSEADPRFLEAIRRIRDRIHFFQQSILHQTVTLNPSPGVTLEQRYLPLKRIGVCVPGGAAAYPSTVLMTVVPAQAAGVQEIAVVAPPTRFGAYNPDILAVCYELGIQEIYAIGGAQAVAALAYGVPEIRGVDKIVGPGSLFVALAKRHVYGQVDIDSIAGPSEVIVLADHTTPPEYAAADMLAQAEHSPGSSIVISWDATILDRIHQSLCQQVDKLERAELTIDALEAYGAMILVRNEQEACKLADQFATEHLHVCIDNPRRLLPHLRNAGATFLGPNSPVALGDYAAGPSHVLPTGGTARWASGLSSNHFLRSSSVIEFDKHALEAIAPDVELLADCEGLTAHRESVSIRRSRKGIP